MCLGRARQKGSGGRVGAEWGARQTVRKNDCSSPPGRGSARLLRARCRGAAAWEPGGGFLGPDPAAVRSVMFGLTLAALGVTMLLGAVPYCTVARQHPFTIRPGKQAVLCYARPGYFRPELLESVAGLGPSHQRVPVTASPSVGLAARVKKAQTTLPWYVSGVSLCLVRGGQAGPVRGDSSPRSIPTSCFSFTSSTAGGTHLAARPRTVSPSGVTLCASTSDGGEPGHRRPVLSCAAVPAPVPPGQRLGGLREGPSVESR